MPNIQNRIAGLEPKALSAGSDGVYNVGGYVASIRFEGSFTAQVAVTLASDSGSIEQLVLPTEKKNDDF
jgi:hypothetical protein